MNVFCKGLPPPGQTVDHCIMIVTSEDLWPPGRQIRTLPRVSAVTEINNETQTGDRSHGAHLGIELFETLDLKVASREAVHRAAVIAGAGYCLVCVIPVARGTLSIAGK